jgi:hypothetical protein
MSTDDIGGVVSRSTFIESQTRGEIDTQITTAKKFPRSITTFKKRAMELATLDEETAQSCFYALPRDGKSIEGPSARLAEIVAGSWGNLRSQANIVDEDDKFITARGVCWDLENNVAISVEVRRRITGKNGRRYNDDMIGTTANAACSIALRNAVFKVVPMAIIKPIYEAAKRVAIGDATTLAARRDKALKHFAAMGVRQEQIFAKLGRAGVEEITLDDLATLLGLSTAIKDGDTSIDEAFAVQSVPSKPTETGTKAEGLAERLKEQQQQQNGEGTTKPETKSEEGERRPLMTCEELMAAIEQATKTEEVTDLVFQRAHLNETEQTAVEAAGRARKDAIRAARK